MIGQTLSHYRITAALGAGGMGEVYRATDTNLGRDVAIKVLPSEVAQDAERLGRFKREAHLLASLNHPNIAAIYGLEEVDGKPFLALELVEGEDLKKRLERGAIPLEEALEVAEQIAEALEEAHNRGIVHRDLKPANVKITPEGKVKVLDFGLAKAWAGDAGEGGSSASMSQSPTLAHSGTAAGIILGTAAYMSPEQARGKPVDKRADVWSFGVLLWEMLTGRTLFAGDTVTDVIAAVVKEEPDLDALPEGTPAAVRRLLSRCLRKDPRTRLPDIGAARVELQDALAGTAADAEAPAAVVEEAVRAEHGRRTRERLAWAAAFALAAGAATLVGYLHLSERPERRSPTHFVLDTREITTFGDFNPPALSPDGSTLAFVGTTQSGRAQLWVRSLDTPGARPLPGTEDAARPFWSPDGGSIAFGAGGELKRVVLASGGVQRVCALPSDLLGGVWTEDGTLVFSSGATTARLYSVPAAGGNTTLFTPHDESRGETGHFVFDYLPDGRQLLVGINAADDAHAGLYAVSLDAPEQRHRILPERARFVFVAPGRLLRVRNGVLEARSFDPKSLVATGEPFAIASNVRPWPGVAPSWGTFGASRGGRVAWLSSEGDVVQLVWVDRKGKRLGTLGEPGRYSQIALSPDDSRVVVEVVSTSTQFDLWVIDVARGVSSRLTTDPASERDPVWSPDSREVVFSSTAGGDQDLLIKGLLGSDPPRPLPGGVGQTRGERDIAEEWSPQGNTLIYMTIDASNAGRTFWTVSPDDEDEQEPQELLRNAFSVDEPRVSPNGRWLAYISQESGQQQIYVEPFRARGEKVRVSTGGGGQPRWRGDGKELFYLSPDGSLMVVTVGEGATAPRIGLPAVLVPAADLRAVVQSPDFDDYAVTSDGQRFLVKRTLETDPGQRIHVLVDWPSLLEE